MAYNSLNIVLVIAVAIMASMVCRCEADLISEVCVKATNPTLCNRALRTDPHSKWADLRGLAEIMVPKTQAAIRVAKIVARAVESSINKPVIDGCIENQNEAMDMINEYRKILLRGKIEKEDLNVKATAASTFLGDCDDGFGEMSSVEPAMLVQASQNAQDFISVLLHISTLM